MSGDWLFVYGTLRPEALVEGTELHRLLTRHARPRGRARCRGRLYRVSWYPALVPGVMAGETVIGELYKLLEPGKVLPVLDRYEGYNPAAGRQSDYLRERYTVETEAGERVTAWIYRYNRKVQGMQRIRSGDFLAN